MATEAPSPLVPAPESRLVAGYARYAPGAHQVGMTADWVLSMTLAGSVEVAHRDGPLLVRAGEFVVVRPGTPQSWTVPADSPPWEVLYTVFRPRSHAIPWLQMPEARSGYVHIPLRAPTTRRRVARALKKAVRLSTFTSFPERMELAMGAVEEALLWCRQEALARRNGIDCRVYRALEYLAQNVDRCGVQVADVVHAAGTSRSRLMAMFREQVGRPPMEHLEHERMQRAWHLLESGMLLVKEVAHACGYEDARYFARRFRDCFGLPPAGVRAGSGRHPPAASRPTP